MSLTDENVSQRVYELQTKFESSTVFEKWVDATFPVMGRFLFALGWNGKIIVSDEAGKILHEIEPRGDAPAIRVMRLVRPPRQLSRPVETASRCATLFKSLEAQLERDIGAGLSYDYLLYHFDRFTQSESDCPGLGKKVKEILGE